MSRVHFLNVTPGDCMLIEHNRGRTTMIDICGGSTPEQRLMKKVAEAAIGNFQRTLYPTNPLDYMQRIGVSEVFRFISTHPDMDHLDGFNALMDRFRVYNFWHTGVHREKPDFGDGCPYDEADWDRYALVRAGQESGTKSLTVLSGDRFKYANSNDENGNDIDGLHILAPDKNLVARAEQTEDLNDASLVVLYLTGSDPKKILFTGDAHDDTFDYLARHHAADISDIDVLIAPHHGRHSDRNFAFLDTMKPKLTLFGSAPSEHLAYGAWNSRGLKKITSNQAGDVVLECTGDEIIVYVENRSFAAADGGDVTSTNNEGFYELMRIGRKQKMAA